MTGLSKGDRGFTDLPRGRIVRKSSPRICALAALDELSCELGFARALLARKRLRAMAARLRAEQELLVALCGHVAGVDAAPKLKAATHGLDHALAELAVKMPKRFVLPGDSEEEAAVHRARAKCRTAETLVCQLRGAGAAAQYLNRLSKYLFALALSLNA